MGWHLAQLGLHCFCPSLVEPSSFLRYYTGLFISPSGISELDCATTKTDTAESNISSTCKLGQELEVSLSLSLSVDIVLSVDMLLSAVSVLVVAQSSSEIPEGLMNNPVYLTSRIQYSFLH